MSKEDMLNTIFIHYNTTTGTSTPAVQQGSGKSLSILHILARHFKHCLASSHGSNGNDKPFLRQLLHQVIEAAVCLTEQCRARQADVVEKQLSCILQKIRELFRQTASDKALEKTQIINNKITKNTYRYIKDLRN